MYYEQQIAATCNATLLHCKLKSVVARITTHLNHCHTTKFVVASWKNLLKKLYASSSCCNMLLQLATTKFCCVTMFEVGGNTCNNVAWKLKGNVARITGPWYRSKYKKVGGYCRYMHSKISSVGPSRTRPALKGRRERPALFWPF